jgi:hypothetical protein
VMAKQAHPAQQMPAAAPADAQRLDAKRWVIP